MSSSGLSKSVPPLRYNTQRVLRGLDIFYYPPFLSLCFNFIIYLLHRKSIFKMALYILGKFLNRERIVKSNSPYFPYFQQVIEYDFRISTKMTQMQFVWGFFFVGLHEQYHFWRRRLWSLRDCGRWSWGSKYLDLI